MIKYIVVLINLFALYIMQTFFSPDVMVSTSVPTNIAHGDQITVSVIIKKGAIAGVGHLKQELPVGFKDAVVVEAKGAEYKFLKEDNVVKFTWVSLPADEEFTVSYKFTVDSTMKNGTYTIPGKFSYVLNNTKQTYETVSPNIILGNELPPLAETPTVAVEEPLAVSNSTKDPTPTSTISADRTLIGNPEAGMEFTVELTVKKEGIKGFGRIQEILPAGLTALPLKNQGGTFSFSDGVMKIIWDNLLEDQDIHVSYRVAVDGTAGGDQSITGTYSYLEKDDPKKIEIASTHFSIKEKANTIAAATIAPAIDTTTRAAAAPVATPPAADEPITAAISTPPANQDNNISYKVQICALSKTDRSTSYFQSKFSLPGKVNIEFHEGWRKYTTGLYNEYKFARDYRETIKLKGIENPFVTAYNNGKRITIQEALMVASQQWVR
jgi:hypothetical protein